MTNEEKWRGRQKALVEACPYRFEVNRKAEEGGMLSVTITAARKSDGQTRHAMIGLDLNTLPLEQRPEALIRELRHALPALFGAFEIADDTRG